MEPGRTTVGDIIRESSDKGIAYYIAGNIIAHSQTLLNALEVPEEERDKISVLLDGTEIQKSVLNWLKTAVQTE